MKTQRFPTWPLAATLAALVGFVVVSLAVSLAPNPAEAVSVADIQCVNKTVDPGGVDAGDSGTFTYVVTVRNNGSRAADNVVVTDTLPPEIPATATFVSAIPSTPGSCNLPPNGSFTCDLGTLASGAVETVEIMVDFTNAEVGDTFRNFASVSTTTSELNTDNNGGEGSSCDVSVTVRPPSGNPNLVCRSKTATPPTLDEGVTANVLYSVLIENIGDAPATNVSVTDTLTVSNAVTFVSSNIAGDCGLTAGDSLPSGSTITCPVGSLVASGATATVEVTVEVPDPAAGETFANSAVASADGPISSNTCAVTVTVTSRGDEGCTPGFWKNHTDLWPAGVHPTDSFETTFGVSLPVGNVNKDDVTLLQAVKTGGGNCKKLLRHGTAAYLNALFGGFSLSDTEVIDKIQDAVAGGGNCQPEANEFGVANDNKICLVGQ